ncbi:hypothetical protein DPMN_098736 [Dreissena polymorpha]|uniref:Uncharacterized protein n=1 Tax=Dreissena polymorpha TaxID=45954 RepID=A0A9D4R5S4_DREPO|nr:hypothetical protein DPMN_098736 [Dreissena polymorpha]
MTAGSRNKATITLKTLTKTNKPKASVTMKRSSTLMQNHLEEHLHAIVSNCTT